MAKRQFKFLWAVVSFVFCTKIFARTSEVREFFWLHPEKLAQLLVSGQKAPSIDKNISSRLIVGSKDSLPKVNPKEFLTGAADRKALSGMIKSCLRDYCPEWSAEKRQFVRRVLLKVYETYGKRQNHNINLDQVARAINKVIKERDLLDLQTVRTGEILELYQQLVKDMELAETYARFVES